MRKRRWLILLGSALVIGGATFLGSYFWLRYQADEAQRGARQWLNGIGSPQADAPPKRSSQRRLRRGEVVGELAVPRLHLSVMVFEGDDAGILRVGAGTFPRRRSPCRAATWALPLIATPIFARSGSFVRTMPSHSRLQLGHFTTPLQRLRLFSRLTSKYWRALIKI